jgi:hypothetical protein
MLQRTAFGAGKLRRGLDVNASNSWGCHFDAYLIGVTGSAGGTNTGRAALLYCAMFSLLDYSTNMRSNQTRLQ